MKTLLWIAALIAIPTLPPIGLLLLFVAWRVSNMTDELTEIKEQLQDLQDQVDATDEQITDLEEDVISANEILADKEW